MFSSRRITYSALMIALSIIATRFLSIQTPTLRIGFGGIPIMLAGLAFGPLTGFICGAVADVTGFFLHPVGTFFPGFTLSAGLVGAIAPLLLGNKRMSSSVAHLFLAIAVSQVITSLVLNTYWLTIIIHKAAAVLLPARLINEAVYIPLATSMVFVLRRALARFLPSFALAKQA